MRQVIAALVINEPGVLASVAGMFAARGFNIDSLVVGRTQDPNLSRMTIVVNGDENTLDQVRKQLAKLVPVSQIHSFAGSDFIERDMILVSVKAGPSKRSEVIEVVDLFRAKIVDIAPESVVVQLAGTEDKIEAFLELMRPYGILEMARTGVIAMARGMQLTTHEETSNDSAKRVRSLDAPPAQALPPS
ncbi:MAG: acetolactate synthase small subunit [Phycisphaerales bacterium]|nr:acetolactate synthase small subunit [Phycisphaerales bacterium]